MVGSRADMLKKAFEVTTPYMPRDAGANLIDNFKVSTQWSRKMNALKLWLTLRIHGRHAYEEHIDRQLHLARWFAEQIRISANFELFAEPMLPIFNLHLKNSPPEEERSAARHQAVVDEVTLDGKQWISTTRVNGQTVIRVMIISYLTQQRHLEELLQRLERAAK